MYIDAHGHRGYSPCALADDAKTLLVRVFERDRALADAVAAFVAADRADWLRALADAVQADRDAESEEVERRLVRLAAIVSDLDGHEAADVALALLDAKAPIARAAAGEALLDLAVDGGDAVLDAAGAASLRTDRPRASRELPYLLAEIGHRRSSEVTARLLGHEDPSVVAAAIEALVLLGDASVAPALRKLTKDARVATVADEDDAEVTVPIAALAEDALAEIERPVGPPGRRR